MTSSIKQELGTLKRVVTTHNNLRRKSPTVSKKEAESEAAVFNKIITLLNEVDQELDRITRGSQ